MCIGDSIARNICLAIMRLARPNEPPIIYQKHADFHHSVPVLNDNSLELNGEISFYWKPFTHNATELLQHWQQEAQPHLILMSTGLWDMLYARSDAFFSSEIESLAQSSRSMLRTDSSGPLVVLANIVEVHHQLLTNPEKRKAMTPDAVDSYNEVIFKSFLDGAYGILDMFSLTYGETYWLFLNLMDTCFEIW